MWDHLSLSLHKLRTSRNSSNERVKRPPRLPRSITITTKKQLRSKSSSHSSAARVSQMGNSGTNQSALEACQHVHPQLAAAVDDIERYKANPHYVHHFRWRPWRRWMGMTTFQMASLITVKLLYRHCLLCGRTIEVVIAPSPRLPPRPAACDMRHATYDTG